MTTRFAFAALAWACLALCGCNSGPKDLLVGKWEAGQDGAKMTAEFASDGKVTLTMLGQPLQGTYKVNGDDELEWTINGETAKCKMKVTEKELQLTNGGQTIKYRKV